MIWRDIYHWAEMEKCASHEDLNNMKRGEHLGKYGDIKAVMEAGIASEYEVKEAASKIYGLKWFNGTTETIDVIKEINVLTFAEMKFLAEYKKDKEGRNRTVEVYIVKPKDRLLISDKLREFGVRCTARFYLILEDDFSEWLLSNNEYISSVKFNNMADDIDKIENDDSLFDEDTYLNTYEEDVDAASVVNMTNKLLLEAAGLGASDVHIEPQEKEILIKFRIDGVLSVNATLRDRAIYKQMVNRIKVVSRLDTNQTRIPQDGKMVVTAKSVSFDARVSTMPTLYGEKVTIRLLNKDSTKIMTLDQLGVPEDLRKKIGRMMAKPNGIILISGPTGSGKSSTLASMLSNIDTVKNCLITIEDPVEFKLRGATQINVDNRVQLTFETVLRAALRQDPDVLMVGEIRDTQTAKVAMQGANTGHLVLSTVHTNTAASTVVRLVDMGVDDYLVADHVIGVVNQQLVRVLCKHCKEEYIIGEKDVEDYRVKKSLVGKKAYRSVGCVRCNKLGYQGRTITLEVLELSSDIAKLIIKEATSAEVEQKAVEQGMVRKIDHAYSLVEAGITSTQEVYRVYGGVNE